MTSERKRLSYANVMATIAVFLALGGGAYASLRVPAHSVGTRQLKKNAVTGWKVRNGSLTGADIAPRSLTAANLRKIGLANLLGASGAATNKDAVSLAPGTCGRYAFDARGAQPGDAVVLGGTDSISLNNAIVGAPTVQNPNVMRVSICAGQGDTLDQAAGTVQLRFDTLR
jgi:hypothetical protein